MTVPSIMASIMHRYSGLPGSTNPLQEISMRMMNSLPVLTVLVLVFSVSQLQAASITSGTSIDAAGITAIRDSFRVTIGGGAVAGANGSFGGIRREINWDGVPDAFSAPNLLPANFFNVNSPRGVVFSTPGTGVEVSANAGIAPVEFGNINPN